MSTPPIENPVLLTDQFSADQASPAATVEGHEWLYSSIAALFAAGREEHFEDGMESDFSRGLVAVVEMRGVAAIEVMEELIVGGSVNAGVASEALRWMGRVEAPGTHERRRRMLERCLDCSSSLVRDGAGLGLASLDDPRALPALRAAVEREKVPELREDLQQVVEQLEATQRCRSS